MNKGYFGDYGGLFIPETLSHALNELEKLYIEIKDDKDFNVQLTDIYKDYVGRPSPLYFAESLTKHLNGPEIWFKREDLNMAGHSHWAGIKHKKGRQDKERAKLFSKL